jgi:hypothetical protein
VPRPTAITRTDTVRTVIFVLRLLKNILAPLF